MDVEPVAHEAGHVASCSQPECNVRQDGLCYEGVTPPEDCPHFEWEAPSKKEAAQAETVDDSQETDESQSDPGYLFYDGLAMDSTEARAITRRALTRVVALVGPSGSGKTTLLASLWEAFRQGPLDEYWFAGSRTQAGFERRCFLSYTASDRATPDTRRTPLSEGIRYLHLAVREKGFNDPVRHLLFTDVSGELFERLAASAEETRRFSPLRRADHVALLLDGEKIVDPRERQTVRNTSRSLLKSCFEADVLHPNATLDIVFSKWDLVEPELDVGQTQDFLRAVESELLDLASTSSPSTFRVAARPTQGSSLSDGYNVDVLLARWAEPRLMSFPAPSHEIRPDDRESVRYLRRRFL